VDTGALRLSVTAFSRRNYAGVSFRDPSGRLLLTGDRALRLLTYDGAAGLSHFLATDAARMFTGAGRLVSTTFIEDDDTAFSLPNIEEMRGSGEEFVMVEHERIPWPSFPYEWSPEMLHAAGSLTLDLAEGGIGESYSLKDATPYNVLFRGPRPVFVDLLSFELRDPHDPTWLPLNQFTRTFLLPLLTNKYFGLRLDQLLAVNRDGLELAEVARLCSPARKLRPPFLSMVSLPYWLGARGTAGGESIYRRQRLANAEQSRFILREQFKRLRRQLAKVAPVEDAVSGWSDYMTPDKFFSADYLHAKETFVARVLEEFRPQRVLDVGCNTGHFSLFAARGGASVVAIDQDPAVVGTVWRRAAAEDLDILALVVNLARPTPAFGWRNEECPSFLERTRGRFDWVLMLAVLHHMLVTEQVPLPAILELASELTTELLVIEFVAPEDPMFRRLVRGREELFGGLSREFFEQTSARWFEPVRAEQLSPTRRIYALRKRG
jgi:SAM-dependent methyltransferase